MQQKSSLKNVSSNSNNMKKNLRFMVDVGVGKNIESWLQSEGFDTVAIRDLDPRMSDTDALKLAFSENRDEKLSAVQKIIDQHGELLHGSSSTYQDEKLRIRK